MSKLSLEEVQLEKILPHRKPMLMVDEIKLLTEDVVETLFKVEKTNIFVNKLHFNEPGLIENIAQTCSIIVGSSYLEEGQVNNSDVIGYISGIKKMDIYGLPKVNEILISKGVLLSRFDSDQYSISTMQGTIHCNEKLLLECELNLFIKKNSNEG